MVYRTKYVVSMQAFSDLVQGNTGVFIVIQREVEVLEALRSGALEEIIQSALQMELVELVRN